MKSQTRKSSSSWLDLCIDALEWCYTHRQVIASVLEMIPDILIYACDPEEAERQSKIAASRSTSKRENSRASRKTIHSK